MPTIQPYRAEKRAQNLEPHQTTRPLSECVFDILLQVRYNTLADIFYDHMGLSVTGNIAVTSEQLKALGNSFGFFKDKFLERNLRFAHKAYRDLRHEVDAITKEKIFMKKYLILPSSRPATTEDVKSLISRFNGNILDSNSECHIEIVP